MNETHQITWLVYHLDNGMTLYIYGFVPDPQTEEILVYADDESARPTEGEVVDLTGVDDDVAAATDDFFASRGKQMALGMQKGETKLTTTGPADAVVKIILILAVGIVLVKLAEFTSTVTLRLLDVLVNILPRLLS